VQHVKGAMDAVGLRGGPTRPPRLPLEAAEREALHAAVAALRAPATA
jgi:4-hydroxy-tetrahydrodipicolinate synthase